MSKRIVYLIKLLSVDELCKQKWMEYLFQLQGQFLVNVSENV